MRASVSFRREALITPVPLSSSIASVLSMSCAERFTSIPAVRLSLISPSTAPTCSTLKLTAHHQTNLSLRTRSGMSPLRLTHHARKRPHRRISPPSPWGCTSSSYGGRRKPHPSLNPLTVATALLLRFRLRPVPVTTLISGSVASLKLYPTRPRLKIRYTTLECATKLE